MVSFLALYRGDSVNSAQLVAVSTDRDLVSQFAGELVERESSIRDEDPVAEAKRAGEIRALELVRDES